MGTMEYMVWDMDTCVRDNMVGDPYMEGSPHAWWGTHIHGGLASFGGGPGWGGPGAMSLFRLIGKRP